MPLKPFAPNRGGDKKIFLLKPRGFCAGVVRAIDVVKIALDLYGPPVYVRKEIVQNKYVVDELREAVASFVEELDEVPARARAIFSAHGVAPQVRRQAREPNLEVIDATCPLVTKVHMEAVRFARDGYTIVLIGHEGHDEVLGTMGEAPQHMVLVEDTADVEALTLPAGAKLAFLTQTTLSVDEAKVVIDALRKKYPQVVGPNKDDICYATQNRQEAVRELVPEADVVLVLGSRNSSNSQRLAEIARATGRRAYLIDRAGELNGDWFRPTDTVLITAGASAPEEHVRACVDYLRERFGAQVESRTVREEHVSFPLPRELRVLASN